MKVALDNFFSQFEAEAALKAQIKRKQFQSGKEK
jgi:hypothetical protein